MVHHKVSYVWHACRTTLELGKGIARPYPFSSHPFHSNVETLGGKYFCCQPVCCAEEEEEEPSCGSSQSATTTDVAGEEGSGPPHARDADNTRQEICSVDEEHQFAFENRRTTF